MLIIAASGVLRLIVAALTPVFPDETYYWEWSRRLALGYFDHPPVIAWLIRMGTAVLGDRALGVRLGSVLAGALSTYFLCRCARRLSGDSAALLVAVVFAVMPLSAVGLVLASPDAPLLAAASATLYAVVRALESAPRSRESLQWWAAAGVALGLALCSKYTGVLLPLGVLVALLARRDLRPRLLEPGPYLATVVALLVFLPVVVWNARHGWVSFAFQLRHGFEHADGAVVTRELELFGGQAALVSPVLFLLCAIAVARSLRTPRSATHALFAIVAVVVFAFFMYSATKRRVEANWPALAYLPAVVLAASVAANATWMRWMRAGLIIGAALTFVVYVDAFTPILPVPAARDPVARAAGWRDLGRAVDRASAARLSASSVRIFVAGDRYQESSALAFHLPQHPETFSLNIDSRDNQYDLWPTFAARAHSGDRLVLVVDDGPGPHPAVTRLTPHFATVRQGDGVALARNGDVVKTLRIWILDGWRGTWPRTVLRSRS